MDDPLDIAASISRMREHIRKHWDGKPFIVVVHPDDYAVWKAYEDMVFSDRLTERIVPQQRAGG